MPRGGLQRNFRIGFGGTLRSCHFTATLQPPPRLNQASAVDQSSSRRPNGRERSRVWTRTPSLSQTHLTNSDESDYGDLDDSQSGTSFPPADELLRQSAKRQDVESGSVASASITYLNSSSPRRVAMLIRLSRQESRYYIPCHWQKQRERSR